MSCQFNDVEKQIRCYYVLAIFYVTVDDVLCIIFM